MPGVERLLGSRATRHVSEPIEDLGGFVEIVQAGAFSRSLRDGGDVLALVHRNTELVLGRRSAGTLRVAEDTRGLAFDVTLPDTQAARTYRSASSEATSRARPSRSRRRAAVDRRIDQGGKAIRELLDVDLHDITVTASPAYSDTAVALRSLATLGGWRLRNARRFLETTEATWD